MDMKEYFLKTVQSGDKSRKLREEIGSSEKRSDLRGASVFLGLPVSQIKMIAPFQPIPWHGCEDQMRKTHERVFKC